jgi:catechol-2,3-dioxygenase
MPQMIGVRRVGLIARDSGAVAEFYREVLGLRAVPTDTAALGTRPAAVSAEPRHW